MSALENRVPPLLVAGLIAVLMGLSGTKLPGFELAWTARLTFALPILLLGLGVCHRRRSGASARKQASP